MLTLSGCSDAKGPLGYTSYGDGSRGVEGVGVRRHTFWEYSAAESTKLALMLLPLNRE